MSKNWSISCSARADEWPMSENTPQNHIVDVFINLKAENEERGKKTSDKIYRREFHKL